MRYRLGETEDTYFVSGHGVEKIEKFLKQRNENIELNQVKRDRYAVFSDQINPIEFYIDFMSSINIKIRYDFENFNNFIEGNSKGTLKKLFRIAYSDEKFDDSFIREVKREINRLKSILPEIPSEVHFDDVILSDDYFLDCTEEIQSKFEEQSNIRFNFDYIFNSIEDGKKEADDSSRTNLRTLSKNLFLANYASSIPKTYVSYLLSKFSGGKVEGGTGSGTEGSRSERIRQENRSELKDEIQRSLEDYERALFIEELRKNRREANELKQLKRYIRQQRGEDDDDIIREQYPSGLLNLRRYFTPTPIRTRIRNPVSRYSGHINLGGPVPMNPVIDGYDGYDGNNRRNRKNERVRCIQ